MRFEEDLHLTKDCVLVARHNPWLSDNTNIAEVAKTNPAVAARKRTVPGRSVKVDLGRLPRQRPRRLSRRPHRSRRSEIGPEVADRRWRGPYQRLVHHRLHLGRIEGMARRHDLRCRQGRAADGVQRQVPDPELPGDHRPRQGQEPGDRPRDRRLSGDQEPDLERRAGDRQWLRGARQPPAGGCRDQDRREERPQRQGRADLSCRASSRAA